MTVARSLGARNGVAELIGRPFADERDLRQAIEDTVMRSGTELCRRADVERLHAALRAAPEPATGAGTPSP